MRNPIQIVFWLILFGDFLQFGIGMAHGGNQHCQSAIAHEVLGSTPYSLGCRFGAY